MQIILETVLVAIGNERAPTSFKEEKFIRKWVSSGRGAFIVNWKNTEDLIAPKGTHGYVVNWNLENESIFTSSNILFELARRNCRRLLFLGSDYEGSIETNIRVANCYGFQCYLYKSEDCSEYFLTRISKYSEIIDHDTIVADLDRRISPSQFTESKFTTSTL